MLLRNEFFVPAGVEEVMPVLLDLERVVNCLPGAALDAVQGDAFEGRMSVRLGPMQLSYRGAGTLTADEPGRRIVVEAKGSEQRGSGSATATIVATLREGGADKTLVQVETDLDITGKPAQFGRGVMQDVSDKLLGQFVACLEQRLTAPEPDAAPTPEPPSGAGSPASDGDPTAASSVPPPPPAPPPSAQSTEALDLGSAVLPVLLRSYWKHAVAAVAGLAVLRRMFKR